MNILKLGMFVLVLGMAACTSNVIPVREYCSTFQPIIVHCSPQGCGYYLEGYDFFTKPTADQILAADRTWKTLCK